MEYAILGEDTTSSADKLDKYTGEVDWLYLKPHWEAGVLLYVDPSIDLLEVGDALAADDTDKVQDWLTRADLLKPGELHAQQWEQGEESFRAMVVSPFVLMQPLPSSS